MSDSVSERRERLIESIRAMSAERLVCVEEWLARLECDISLPPSTSAEQRLAAQVSRTHGSDQATRSRDWPHAPLHRLSTHGTYIVTAGTLRKEHWFRGADRLDLLETSLLSVMKQRGWQLEAWAVFSNHYHFVAHALPEAKDLRAVMKELHAQTARELSRMDLATVRAVWHNFWDTKLTFEKSYLARLNYVHQNPVKHGLTPTANQYRWCSAAWFERTATRSQIRTVYSFKINNLKIEDGYEPL